MTTFPPASTPVKSDGILRTAIGCHITNGGNYNVPDSFSIATAVPLDFEIWKQGVIHSSLTDNTKVTIITPGKYFVSFYNEFVNTETGGMGMAVFVNGVQSEVWCAYNNQGSSGNNYFPIIGCEGIVNLKAGDVLVAQIGQKSGGTVTMTFAGTDLYVGWLGY